MPPCRRGQTGFGGRAVGASLGLDDGPLYDDRQGNRQSVAGQAWRTVDHRYRPRQRLPHRRTMMPIPRRKVRRPAWLHAPRRTARIRLATLYGGLFLASGAALVAATYLLFQRATAFTKPALPQVPRAPSLQDLENLPLPKAYAAVANDQGQVVHILKQLGQPPGTGPLSSTKHLFGGSGPDASLDSGLERDQHQLAQATDHLAQAVHQLAQAGSIQAVQRATDSHELLVNSAIAFGIV